MLRGHSIRYVVLALACEFGAGLAAGQDQTPVLLQEDFEKGADRWEPTDPKAWKVIAADKGHVFSQFVKNSKYQPPFRSPYNIALIKDLQATDFVLEAKVRSTIKDYGHRDACLFFGWQDPAHFYYVHLGKKADDHANQIFIVNKAPRTKISKTSTPGTPWTDAWHRVKIVRTTKDGAIAVFFDDMTQPVMTAQDRTFLWGRIGVGSFDDTTEWDDVVIRGLRKD